MDMSSAVATIVTIHLATRYADSTQVRGLPLLVMPRGLSSELFPFLCVVVVRNVME